MTPDMVGPTNKQKTKTLKWMKPKKFRFFSRAPLFYRCMPSAQNSVVILQMEKKAELAASMATTLAIVYLLSAVPIAILLSAILQFVRI